MTLRLNGATSGFTEIDAPAVAGSNTLVLPGSNGSAYQFLRNGATAGTTEFAGSITSGTAVASTSGTSIDFTSIPSYVKRITVMFAGVSTSGTSRYLVQIGAGSVTTSGYVGQSNAMTAVITVMSSGFMVLNNVTAANTNHGIVTLILVGSNTWVESSIIAPATLSNYMGASAGTVTLSGTLDRVRITTVNGTDTFDAGSINILYEG
jgi:hypothetical protein